MGPLEIEPLRMGALRTRPKCHRDNLRRLFQELLAQTSSSKNTYEPASASSAVLLRFRPRFSSRFGTDGPVLASAVVVSASGSRLRQCLGRKDMSQRYRCQDLHEYVEHDYNSIALLRMVTQCYCCPYRMHCMRHANETLSVD